MSKSQNRHWLFVIFPVPVSLAVIIMRVIILTMGIILSAAEYSIGYVFWKGVCFVVCVWLRLWLYVCIFGLVLVFIFQKE